MTFTPRPIDELCVNTIRTLSIDTVERADSGHPGAPMGAAAMAYVLWTRHLRHNPADPRWVNRDRFVLSAGHASALLYSLLHLTGYGLSLNDLQHFRQWGSRTPGHPERDLDLGIEVTTGPLGQGFGNAVGLAIAERWLAATYNRPGLDLIDHRTWVIASDGDLMEGVSAEAASLAGDLKLDRLTVLYDANRITLSGTTNVTFRENVPARFEAYGWHVQQVDGTDLAAIDAALTAAREETDRPSLIMARTHIGYGSPHKQDTFHAHGEPLGAEETRLTKRAYGWPEHSSFLVPEEAQQEFDKVRTRGAALQRDWQEVMDRYRRAHGSDTESLSWALAGQLPGGWDAGLPTYTPDGGPVATRDAGGRALGALAAKVGNLVGGSADLDPSTKTMLKGMGDFQSPLVSEQEFTPPTQGVAGGEWGYAGRNVHFGVREHAMGAVLTGMAHHGGIIPFGATFLTFSDYMRPSIRLAALSRAHVIYVWTHDSIALGEDGPTHQPVEQVASLRAIPNLMLFRPADANETVEAWRLALQHTGGPVGFVLTRQKVPVLDGTAQRAGEGVARGAYVLAESATGPVLQLILIATGSEVALVMEAHRQLTGEGVRSRVVSMPSWDLFEAQSPEYRESVLPTDVTARVSVEAGSPFGWERYVGPKGAIVAVRQFGASAPGPVVMAKYGFTVEHVVAAAMQVLGRHAT